MLLSEIAMVIPDSKSVLERTAIAPAVCRLRVGVRGHIIVSQSRNINEMYGAAKKKPVGGENRENRESNLLPFGGCARQHR